MTTIAARINRGDRCKDPYHSCVLDHVDVDRRDGRRGGPFQASGQPRHGLDGRANLELRVQVDDGVDRALAEKLAVVRRQFVRNEDDVLPMKRLATPPRLAPRRPRRCRRRGCLGWPAGRRERVRPLVRPSRGFPAPQRRDTRDTARAAPSGSPSRAPRCRSATEAQRS